MEVKKHYASLSEAIREGAKLRPQATGTYFDKAGGSCALGAALEAVFGYEEDDIIGLAKLYDYFDRGQFLCPMSECSHLLSDGLDVIIPHLNDVHGWTREAIADWLFLEEEKLGYVLLTEEPETCNIKDQLRTPELAGVLTG